MKKIHVIPQFSVDINSVSMLIFLVMSPCTAAKKWDSYHRHNLRVGTRGTGTPTIWDWANYNRPKTVFSSPFSSHLALEPIKKSSSPYKEIFFSF